MPFIASTRDAIVTLLNGHTFSPQAAPTAAAAYEVAASLKDMTIQTARLLVIPRESDPQLLTFDASEERKIGVHVVLQYKAKTLAATELDPYINLAEQIAEFLLGATLNADAGQVITELTWPEGTWNQEHLQDFQVLTIDLLATAQIEG